MTAGLTHSIHYIATDAEHIIIRRWRGWRHLIALLVGVLIAGVAFSLWSQSARQSAVDPPWWAIAGLAGGVLYYAATGMNRTTFRVHGDRIIVTRGPLPVLGDRRREFTDVTSVNARFDRTVSMRGSVGDTNVIEARLPDGRIVALDLVPNKTQAEQIVQFIHRARLELP